MKQRKGYSVQLVGGAFFLIMLGGGLVVLGFWGVTSAQQKQWIRVMAVLLSFSAGFLFVETGIRQVRQNFIEAVAKRERELGHSLLPERREEIKEAIRATVPKSKNGPGYNFPLMRLVTEVLLLAVPAIILIGFVAAVGAFVTGLGIATLVAELTRRTLPHL